MMNSTFKHQASSTSATRVKIRYEDLYVRTSVSKECTFHALGILLHRRIGVSYFQLETDCGNAITTETAWSELIGAAHGVTLKLQLSACPTNCPAYWVDPFWACEKTDLPQREGIAAAW